MFFPPAPPFHIVSSIMPPRHGSTVGFLVKDADDEPVECAGYVLKTFEKHCVIACAEVGGVESVKPVKTALGSRVFFVRVAVEDLIPNPPWAKRCGVQGLPNVSDLQKLYTEQGEVVSDVETERMETALSREDIDEISELKKRLMSLEERGQGRPWRGASTGAASSGGSRLPRRWGILGGCRPQKKTREMVPRLSGASRRRWPDT